MSQTQNITASVAASQTDHLVHASFAFLDLTSVSLRANQSCTLETNTGGTNEIQRITVTGTPSSGTFTITYGGATTAAIAFDATAAIVKAAFEKLATVGQGNTTCAGGPLPGTAVNITFIGPLGAQDLSPITTTDSFGGGSSPASAITTPTPGVAPGNTIYLIGGQTYKWTAGVNEVQTITITGTPGSGTFTLTYAGQTTSGIAYGATAATVQSALEALSNIAVGDVVCSGGPLPGTAVVCTFAENLGGQPLSKLRFVSSLGGGTNPAGAITTTVQGANYGTNPFTVDVTGLYVTTGTAAATLQITLVTA